MNGVSSYRCQLLPRLWCASTTCLIFAPERASNCWLITSRTRRPVTTCATFAERLSIGETQKPYGRVFYTRGKSLIFYAYDLDQQTATKTVNAFQGRRGPDQPKAVNLGVFFEDNASKKRWVLKCDDPETLAQIDGVFVTVKPYGGSQMPSGKSLLFAYLRADSNHP